MNKSFDIKTSSRTQMVDITSTVSKYVKQSEVKSGLCVIFVTHTTAGVTINENADPSVKSDVLAKLSELIPHQGDYQHTEGNSDAHIKSSLVGCSETVLIEDGSLVLGTWQGIMFCEFDGPRNRRFLVKLLPD
jgi:secondary thiamine-phosphate synthase enzyme